MLPPHGDVKKPNQSEKIIEVDPTSPMPPSHGLGLIGCRLVSRLVTPVVCKAHRSDEMNQEENQAERPDPKKAF